MANSLLLEQFKNGAISQLAFGVGLTDATIGVLNATLFPSVPQFRLLIDSEYMLATGVNPAPLVGPTATDGGANADALHAGAFNVTYTWVMAGGESTQSPNGAVTLATNGNKINIATISGIPSYVSALKFYFNGAVPAGDTNGFVVQQTVSGGSVIAFSITTEGNATVAPAAENIFNVNRGQESSIATTHLASASVVGPLTASSLQNFGPVKLDEFVLTVAAATVNFASIPQIFRHLQVFFYCRSDTAAANAYVAAQFNGDTANNYDMEYSRVGGSGADANAELLTSGSIRIALIPAATATANYFGSGDFFIHNYIGTTGQKNLRSKSFAPFADTTGNQELGDFAGKWRTVGTAITSLKLILSAGNFVTGSVFTLYGIP